MYEKVLDNKNMRKIITLMFLAVTLTSCAQEAKMVSKFELKASDFGQEYVIQDDKTNSILSVFTVGEELSCYYDKNYKTATSSNVISNTLQSPTVALLKSRVDQFKTKSMADRYYAILTSPKGLTCFEKNYATQLTNSLAQTKTKIDSIGSVLQVKKSKEFSYQTIAVTIAPTSGSEMAQDYKVAFYYYKSGNKVFTSVMAYNEDKKVEQVALSLPNALKAVI